LHTLFRLSEDKANAIVQLCTAEILRAIYLDLYRCEELLLSSLIDLVLLVYNIASGVRIPVMRDQLVLLREPLYLVARLHPIDLGTFARDAVWAITQYNISFTTDTTKDSMDENDDLETYFTVKESFDLKELGITLSKKMLASNSATKSSYAELADESHVRAAYKKDKDEEAVENENTIMKLSAGSLKLPAIPRVSSPGHTGEYLSFVSNETKVNSGYFKRPAKKPAMQLIQTKTAKGKLSRKVKDRIVTVVVDVEALPELGRTRPLLPPTKS
jgi:hypothetical protein